MLGRSDGPGFSTIAMQLPKPGLQSLVGRWQRKPAASVVPARTAQESPCVEAVDASDGLFLQRM